MREPCRRTIFHTASLALALLLPAAAGAQEQKIGAPPEARNMRLVGTSDLKARSAYQPTIHKRGDRACTSWS